MGKTWCGRGMTVIHLLVRPLVANAPLHPPQGGTFLGCPSLMRGQWNSWLFSQSWTGTGNTVKQYTDGLGFFPFTITLGSGRFDLLHDVYQVLMAKP